MNYDEIVTQLQTIIEGDVTRDEQDRERHSTDWSLFKIQPEIIVYPQNTRDVEQLISYVNSYNNSHNEKLHVTARAAGSDMSGGPLNSSIIVDVTRYMNHFLNLEVGTFGEQSHREHFSYTISGKARAQSGMKYLAFEKKVGEQSLLMPTYPGSRKLAAIGGMVANNGAGEKSLRYGQNKDFVSSLNVTLADGKSYEISPMSYSEFKKIISQENFLGEVTKKIYELITKHWDLIQSKKPTTTKNASGYLLWDILNADSPKAFEEGNGFFDLTKLFVGAQGTTGIISEIEYKLIKEEKETSMVVMFVNDIYDLPKIVNFFNYYDLETIELYDDHTFKMGVKFFKDFIKDKGFFTAVRYALRFLPEFWMVATGGVPKFIVLAEMVSDNSTILNETMKKLLQESKNILPGVHSFLVTDKGEMQKYIDFRHDSFKLLTEHSKKTRGRGAGTRTAPFIDDIAIRPEFLPEYIPRLTAILDQYKKEFIYTIAGHLGDGNFHIIPVVDMFEQENKDKILEISEQVYTLAMEYGGTLSAEHNDGIIRTPFLRQMFGDEMIEIFKQVKIIFDPNNIFNPGKKVGLTKEDIQKYLA